MRQVESGSGAVRSQEDAALAAREIGETAFGADPAIIRDDICLIAATMGICSSANYAGWVVSLILFLVYMLRFQQKDEIPTDQQVS